MSLFFISYLAPNSEHTPGHPENGVLLMFTLEDVSSVANFFFLLMKSLNKTEAPIFYL